MTRPWARDGRQPLGARLARINQAALLTALGIIALLILLSAPRAGLCPARPPRGCKKHLGRPGVFLESVQDTGVGIPPEAQGKVFEHFAQADGSTTRQFGGTGLGLAICKRLVELMGGSIGLESQVGKGSRFWLDLVMPRAGDLPQAPPEVPRLAGLRVLVVDDNQTNREILEQQLGGWGMAVSCAEGGEQALAAMGEAQGAGRPFDLVILDMHMPGMDGLQLARAIQARPELAPTRRIMLTSTSTAGNAKERDQAGILRCVNKPVRQSALYDILTQVLAPGQGTRPTPPAPFSAAGTGAPAPQGGGLRGRVLLAEDNPVNQEVAKAMLSRLA